MGVVGGVWVSCLVHARNICHTRATSVSLGLPVFLCLSRSRPVSLSLSHSLTLQVDAAAARLSATGPERAAAASASSCAAEGAQSQPIAISLPLVRERAHSLSPKGSSPSLLFGASPLPPHPYSFVVSSNVHSHFSPPTCATPPLSLIAGARKRAMLTVSESGGQGGGGDGRGGEGGAGIMEEEEVAGVTDPDARSTAMPSAFRRVGVGQEGHRRGDEGGGEQGARRPAARGMEEPLLREGLRGEVGEAGYQVWGERGRRQE